MSQKLNYTVYKYFLSISFKTKLLTIFFILSFFMSNISSSIIVIWQWWVGLLNKTYSFKILFALKIWSNFIFLTAKNFQSLIWTIKKLWSRKNVISCKWAQLKPFFYSPFLFNSSLLDEGCWKAVWAFALCFVYFKQKVGDSLAPSLSHSYRSSRKSVKFKTFFPFFCCWFVRFKLIFCFKFVW